MGLVHKAVANGGALYPIIVPDGIVSWRGGITNPSVFVHEDKVRILVRCTNYTLYHSTTELNNHFYGPLQYIHPEHDLHLRTENVIVELDNKFNFKTPKKIDTSKLDNPVMASQFIGLEDARLFNWEGRFFGCGVRRDVDAAMSGRMEMTEIVERSNAWEEIARYRIAAPNGNGSFCEKNWMPILDQPFHFIKWSNPAEIVEVNLEDGGKASCKTVLLDESRFVPNHADFRGSSQAVPYKDGYLVLIHETNLYQSQLGAKNAQYMHRFLFWDKDFENVQISKRFTFLEGNIEFCCGMALRDNELLISFGYQDNSAFLLRMNSQLLGDLF